MLVSNIGCSRGKNDRDRAAKPFCECWHKKEPVPVSWQQLSVCVCGEDTDVSEWKWEVPAATTISSSVVVSEDKKQVIFHPVYSSGTAAVRGDTPMQHGYHYYWEVKMLSETYGTDIMVGIGTDKVNVPESQFKFTSLLGQDAESYGLSYLGMVRHNAMAARDSAGFCRGSIIGVRLDMWNGTLEFYINRQPQGVSFYNLRRHQILFPMISSTAAQSSLRLIYAASWRASLLVDSAKILASSLRSDKRIRLPPGLWHKFKTQFWLTLPTEGCVTDENKDESMEKENARIVPTVPLSSGIKRMHWWMMSRAAYMTSPDVS